MPKIAVLALLATLVALPAAAADPQTDDQKTLYALGLALSRQVKSLKITDAEFPFVAAGFADGVLDHQTKVDLDAYGPKVQALVQARAASAATEAKAAGQAFLDKAATEPGAKKTASGMVIQEIKPGTGASPTATNTVKVHYHGTLPDGTVFDSSVQRGQPATFPLNGVIKCWTEGLQLMKVGGKSKLVCPPELAYGDRSPSPKIPAGATLVFEVELLDIEK